MSNLAYRKFTADELRWVGENYRALRPREKGGVLRGTLEFRAAYQNCGELHDEYQVEIRISSDNLPHVWETKGRLEDRAKQLGKKMEDLHVDPKTKEACMGTIPIMQKICSEDPTIKGMFYNLIIRYFYYHTHWERMGVEPWPGLPHGIEGVLQEYADNRGRFSPLSYAAQLPSWFIETAKDGKKFRPNDKCLFCGCKVKKCACNGMNNYNIFRQDVRKILSQSRR